MSMRHRRGGLYGLVVTLALGSGMPLPAEAGGVRPGRIELAQADRPSVSVTALVDRDAMVAETKRAGDDSAGIGDIVLYDSVSASGPLSLRPNRADVMGIWKRDAVLTRYGKPELAYGPALILLDIKNNGSTTTQVTDGYLDVAESQTDFQPYVDLTADNSLDCADTDQKLDPKFGFRNTGWGEVRDARITYGFAAQKGRLESVDRTFTASLGSFLDRRETTVMPALQELGVDVKRLQSTLFPCESKRAVPLCLRELVGRGVFGRMSPGAIERMGNTAIVVTKVAGVLEYGWRDAKGTIQKRRSPYEITIPLTSFKTPSEAECGAGGPGEAHPKIKLRTDGARYRVPLQYRTTLAPGRNTRLRLSIGADKASQHSFRAVLQLSDGSEVRSGPIDLLYFVERAGN